MSDHLDHSEEGGRFQMLYCDSAVCRVNTFERGESEQCPGCGRVGGAVR